MTSIDSLLHEDRRFPPSPEFVATAIATAALSEAAQKDRLGFWADRARELHWHTAFTQTLDWSNAPFATWFGDGSLNVAYNCLDRHVLAGNGDRVALHWEGEPGDSRSYTYAELTTEVKRAANALVALGVTSLDSAQSTRWCSADSAPTRYARGSTTRRRNSSSRPTAGGAKARCSL
jgi:acetyl-CoA synthetase